MSLIIFILILVSLILVHEFGHFIIAKAFGIRVDEFGIFFPPRIFAIKWRGTEYSLNWLPFGGFVKIFGENGEQSQEISKPEQNSVAEPKTDAESSAQALTNQTFPRNDSASAAGASFVHKPRPVQAAVIVAGIVFNLAFAWLILSAGYMVGIPTSADHKGFGTVQNAHATIVDVLPGSPADKAGLKAGDVVETVITGTASLQAGATAENVQQFIAVHQDESIGLTVQRGGAEVSAIAVPVAGIAEGHKALGVALGDVGVLKLSLLPALGQGALLAKEITISTAAGLLGFFAQIFHGTADFAGVSGPIGIAGMGSTAVQEGIIATIILTALISINLAIINLLPIPGLDGGRLLFIVIEAITRRPISPRFTLAFTLAGFGLLILLMIVVSYHDVLNLVRPV
ncbi:MAG: site-2 protease family protein [Candidatus Adlerbacteria bacterium]|nr:site-2 protease family protein [Candidatus Adlerbacteria bacterium]